LRGGVAEPRPTRQAFDTDGRVNPRFKTREQGAATSVWCATSPRLDSKGGVYCEDCDIARLWRERMGYFSRVRPHAIDPDAAERLWTLSEIETGQKFPAQGPREPPANKRELRNQRVQK
jgi:hypothetical protein